jgi:hypothetical protein
MYDAKSHIRLTIIYVVFSYITGRTWSRTSGQVGRPHRDSRILGPPTLAYVGL